MISSRTFAIEQCSNSVRLMTNIVDAEDSELEVGQQVALVWEKMSDMVSIPRFRLVK